MKVSLPGFFKIYVVLNSLFKICFLGLDKEYGVEVDIKTEKAGSVLRHSRKESRR